MRILLVTNMYPVADRLYYGIFVKEQVDAVCSLGHDVSYDVEFIRGDISKMEYLRSIFRIARKAKKGYDLIHIHYGLSGLFLLGSRRPPVPVVLTLHGGDIQPEQGKTVQVALTRRILRRVDAAISLNQRMTDIVRPLCPNVAMIPCSVDTDIFFGDEKMDVHSHGIPVDIIFPSDPSRGVKNYPLFEKTVEILSANYGLEVRTHVIADMSRDEVSALMRRADLLLMTSISEGSPQVVKEAMACNLPVVSTPVGDVRVLLDGVCRSAVSVSHNAEELASLAYDSLCGRPAGMSGRSRIFGLGLDKKTVGEKVYQIYKEVLR